MARPRVYRHDVRCPECGSKRLPKDGTSQGRQADYCGDCGCRAIPDAAYQRPAAADKERALAMYQQGSSLSAIVRIFVLRYAGGQPVSQKDGALLHRMRQQSRRRTIGGGTALIAIRCTACRRRMVIRWAKAVQRTGTRGGIPGVRGRYRRRWLTQGYAKSAAMPGHSLALVCVRRRQNPLALYAGITRSGAV